VYLAFEPCVMCSMALLHSRVAKVFYSLSHDKQNAGTVGALN